MKTLCFIFPNFCIWALLHILGIFFFFVVDIFYFFAKSIFLYPNERNDLLFLSKIILKWGSLAKEW